MGLEKAEMPRCDKTLERLFGKRSLLRAKQGRTGDIRLNYSSLLVQCEIPGRSKVKKIAVLVL